ncbi:MAG: twin-arginine translocation signal domain-containing protein, partial [Terriglobia bacterium]
MGTSRRKFLQTSAAAAAFTAVPGPAHGSTAVPPAGQSSSLTPPGRELDPLEIARRHAFVKDAPTPNFFEGMLLGNGDVGLCVTVRPDGLGLHIGKNDCWDIRVSEDNYHD